MKKMHFIFNCSKRSCVLPVKAGLFIFLLFLASGFSLFAQSRDFIPYVTQISIEARNNLIMLTWVDSPDARGSVYIFRSTRPFTGTIPANIRPVVVRYGEQFFVDETDDIVNLYYFIAASDTSGQRYDIILPQINSTSLFTVQNPADVSAPVLLSPAISTPPQTETIEGINNLRAVQDGDRVIITYDTSASDFLHSMLGGTQPGRNAILYRSTSPIQRPQDLLNAVIVQSGISSPFFDMPIPGLSWFYAIIYEDEISSGNMGIRPGINATVSAVTIYSELSQERSLRPMPLPILTLRNTMPDSFFIIEMPVPIPLSAESIAMLQEIQMPQKSPLNLKRPRVFSVDLIAPVGGEESALFQIIMEYFVQHEWENARVSLQHYLSLPRSREVEARARFYLGQTFYYTENYREALMEFLSFRTHNLAEANSWIDAVLTAMVY